jgi:hypothetical protein
LPLQDFESARVLLEVFPFGRSGPDSLDGMEETMRSAMRVVCAVTLASSAASVAGASAVVIVAEGDGLAADSLRTVRSIAATELRARGVPVVEDERLEGVRTVGPETMTLAQALGAQRVFAFRLGRLGQKILMSLEEIQPPGETPVYVARLTASSLDESDTVIPRLVRSVLEREPVAEGARLTTMTDQESVPFKKKPGEGLFILGVGMAPLGGSIGWSYEARTWRLGVLFQGAENDPSFFGVEGAWIPLETSISPYVSVGLGAVGAANDGGESALGTKLELGVEFFRLHGVRLFTGVSAIVPFESLPATDGASVGAFVRVGF